MTQACIGLALLCQIATADATTQAEVAVVEESAPLALACDMPICGPLGERLYCIEFFESRHNGNAVNRSSGARGWLQWLASTARTWQVDVGNRQSEWSAAARVAGRGEALFRSTWVPLQRGLC